MTDALSATIGVVVPSARNARQIWAPDIRGRFMSRTMRSKTCDPARAYPSRPSVSTVISWPSRSRASTNRSAFIRSSSTSKTRKAILLRDRGPQPGHQALAVDRLDQILVVAHRPGQTLVVLDRHHHHGHAMLDRPDHMGARLAKTVEDPEVEAHCARAS